MSESQNVFGKRGARLAQPIAAPSNKPNEPSAAYLELAAAARRSLNEHDARAADDRRSYLEAAPRDEDADMRAFIGGGWRAYRATWEKMKGAPRLTMSRSYAAAAFTSIWLLYRKQYVRGLALLAVQASMFKWQLEWSPVFDLLVAAFLAEFGKSIVLMRGVGVIRRIRSVAPSSEVAAIRIAGAGGVDWVSALCGAALLTGIVASSAAALCAPGNATDIDIDALERLFPRK